MRARWPTARILEERFVEPRLDERADSTTVPPSMLTAISMPFASITSIAFSGVQLKASAPRLCL